MLTAATNGSLLLALSCLVLRCWATESPELSYLQCVNMRSLSPRKVLVFPLNQIDLKQPGPSACAESCIQINDTYVYFLVHVPAGGSFTNKLVCGCGNAAALQSVPLLPDSSCNLPCPLGRNSTDEYIDAVQMTGGSVATGVMEPWFPDRPAVTSQSKGPRFLALPGGIPVSQKNTTKRRSRPPATHRTCGDGHGLLSAYEFSRNGYARNSQLKIVALLVTLLRYIM